MMKPMMKRALQVGAVLGALAVGGLALAGGPPGFPGHLERLAEELELTEAQRAKLEELKTEAKADREDHKDDMRALHEQLKAELLAEKPNAANVHRLIDQRQAIMNAGAHAHADRVLEFAATLTPEQKAELAALIEERQQRHEARGEGGPHGPPHGGGKHGGGKHGGGKHGPRGER